MITLPRTGLVFNLLMARYAYAVLPTVGVPHGVHLWGKLAEHWISAATCYQRPIEASVIDSKGILWGLRLDIDFLTPKPPGDAYRARIPQRLGGGRGCTVMPEDLL